MVIEVGAGPVGTITGTAANVAAIVWAPMTLVNVWELTAPTEPPSTSTSAIR
jgi:hypothetical protein